MRRKEYDLLRLLVIGLTAVPISICGQAMTVPPQIPPQYPAPPAGRPFPVEAAKPCLPSATHPYENNRTCTIRVDRAVRGSPLPVTVPPGTTVQIFVDGRLPMESILFIQTLDSVPTPDYGLAIVKAFSPRISAITMRGGGKSHAAHLRTFLLPRFLQKPKLCSPGKRKENLHAIEHVPAAGASRSCHQENGLASPYQGGFAERAVLRRAPRACHRVGWPVIRRAPG